MLFRSLGFFAKQDVRTPVKIAVTVLICTQLMNLALVPWLAHAGLALSISLGAWLNAGWLLRGLKKRGSYTPRPGWRPFMLKVALALAVMSALLGWGAESFDWVALQGIAVRQVQHAPHQRPAVVNAPRALPAIRPCKHRLLPVLLADRDRKSVV